MRNRTHTTRKAAGLAIAVGAFLAVAPAAEATTLFGITQDGELAKFKSNNPSNVNTKELSGLPDGVKIVGIDQRPTNGELYGIGDDSTVYEIATSGEATAVGDGFDNPQLVPLSMGAPLEGNSFGVDFNPTSGAIRIVSNEDQSLRVSPETGDLVAEDADLNGANAQVIDAGYTNSRQNETMPTTTVLYVLDALKDKVYTQNPPNDGVLTNPVDLDIDLSKKSGFDMVGKGRRGFIVDDQGDSTTLYQINAEVNIGLDGDAEKLGKVKAGSALVALAAVQPGG